MKITFILILGLIFSLGCARVRVEAPKEPIKVDISMRLDIYQHIQKDIDNIENIVSGSQEKAKSKGDQSMLDYFAICAYAQEGLSPEVEQAALRRKARYAELISWQEKGMVGENKLGLLEIRKRQDATPKSEELIKAENNDRMIIYQSIAKKNNSPVEEVQKIYAKRLQQDAPQVTPIEVLNASTGAYEWKIK
jgi:uncharacterized protein YdbL (DUF1318 family)